MKYPKPTKASLQPLKMRECTADAMVEALAIIEDEFESKVDAVAFCLIKNMKARAKAL